MSEADATACVEQTEGALELLQDSVPGYYDYVNKYIGAVICLESGSGMKANWDPPTAKVGARTRQAGTLWYAGFLVHEACHSEQYHGYLVDHQAERAPHDVYSGRDAEWECIQIQASAFEDMGADPRLIEVVLESINTEYWKIPSGERDW